MRCARAAQFCARLSVPHCYRVAPASPSCVADFQTETLSHPSPRPSLHSLRRALSSACSSAADGDAECPVGCADAIRRRGDRRCSRCSASTRARSATHVKILRCRLQLADGRQGQGRLAAHPRHTLARRLRAVTAPPLCCGFAGPHRWRMDHTGTLRERERGSDAELGDYAPLDWHADAVRPARPQHSATEDCAVGLATLTHLLFVCAAVARRSRRSRVRLNWPVPTSVARRA